MISRIQEIYLQTDDHVYAVCAGIEQSAKVVTYAAVLLCVVLGAFLSSEIIMLKYIGVGIAFTIIFDASIVRSFLVPALMSVAGRYAWWAPEPLQKFAAYLNIRETEGEEIDVRNDDENKIQP